MLPDEETGIRINRCLVRPLDRVLEPEKVELLRAEEFHHSKINGVTFPLEGAQATKTSFKGIVAELVVHNLQDLRPLLVSDGTQGHIEDVPASPTVDDVFLLNKLVSFDECASCRVNHSLLALSEVRVGGCKLFENAIGAVDLNSDLEHCVCLLHGQVGIIVDKGSLPKICNHELRNFNNSGPLSNLKLSVGHAWHDSHHLNSLISSQELMIENELSDERVYLYL